MSAAQDYYDQVLAMGHSAEDALAHTRQHYPDFIPGDAAPIAAPAPKPMSQQAIPAVEPVSQPVIEATPPLAVSAPAVAIASPTATPEGAYAPVSIPVPEQAEGPSRTLVVVGACIAAGVVALLALMML